MASESNLLAGIRVLDLSQFIPGPYTALLLSDLGADVVKIEPPNGDPQREDGPLGDDQISLWYKIINRNKRIITVDLKDDVGRRHFEILLGSADVLLESFRPGVLERLGFSRSRIEAINPRLIHCALSGWGQTGPYRLKAGHDINYQAMAAILDLSGTREVPVPANPPIADYAGALQSVFLISAALFSRTVTGCGCFIDVGLSDAVVSVIGTEIASLSQESFDVRRGVGPYAGGWACYHAYRAECGRYVTLGALEARFWANFCRLVDRPDWIQRQYEPRPQSSLIAEVGKLFSSQPADHWTRLLAEAETCFFAVQELKELVSDPQIAERKLLARGEDGLMDALLPAWIGGAPPPPRRSLRQVDVADVIRDWPQVQPPSTVAATR